MYLFLAVCTSVQGSIVIGSLATLLEKVCVRAIAESSLQVNLHLVESPVFNAPNRFFTCEPFTSDDISGLRMSTARHYDSLTFFSLHLTPSHWSRLTTLLVRHSKMAVPKAVALQFAELVTSPETG